LTPVRFVFVFVYVCVSKGFCLHICTSPSNNKPTPKTNNTTAKIPGVNQDGAGFWSVTAYSLPDRKLVPNVLGRYSVQSSSKQLKFNPDGSLEIYMQADAPGDGKQGNWLPTPGA
jgi:hypothetical protein